VASNKTRTYTVLFAYKDDGNRKLNDTYLEVVQATTVQRAIPKLVRTMNEEEPPADGERALKASDLLIIDVRTAEATPWITAKKSVADADAS
jgi:hypothetical protein